MEATPAEELEPRIAAVEEELTHLYDALLDVTVILRQVVQTVTPFGRAEELVA
jgi:hypothetical protein